MSESLDKLLRFAWDQGVFLSQPLSQQVAVMKLLSSPLSKEVLDEAAVFFLFAHKKGVFLKLELGPQKMLIEWLSTTTLDKSKN